jgi:hypothetical protein
MTMPIIPEDEEGRKRFEEKMKDCDLLASEYLEKSAKLIKPFRQSETAKIAAAIMENRDAYEDRKLRSATRDVYRIGSFSADGKEHHAVLKLTKGLADFSKIAFEAFFFSECSLRPDVDYPLFVMLPRSGLTQGIVMEDISEGGRYQIEELAHRYDDMEQLPFPPNHTYRAGELNHLRGLSKVRPIVLDDSAYEHYWLRDMEHYDLKSTSFIVHDESEVKRIVCGDADQLHHRLGKSVTHDRIAKLEQLVFTLE